MENVVGIVKGTDKFASLLELLEITDFNETILKAQAASKKDKHSFKIVIKPNMMVFVNPEGHTVLVTDKDLVEYLVDHLLKMGFSDISVCEAQNDVGQMLKNHNVKFVAEHIGYNPKGRYKIVDLSLEEVPYQYIYRDDKGKDKKWKDSVGITWRDADFRISFAKCKTHEHDWMTLSVKNIYGCFPSPQKVAKYHIKSEVWDVTSRSLRNFPVHFALVDGWTASDGFQGYKIPHPQELHMLFGGNNAVAVDMEVFKRADLDPHKSKILRRSVEQLYHGKYPKYHIKGDQHTRFSKLCPWENITDDIVNSIDILEEVYIGWAVINLKPAATAVDYNLFPPKSFVERIMVWSSKKLYGIFKLFKWYRKIYQRTNPGVEDQGVSKSQ